MPTLHLTTVVLRMTVSHNILYGSLYKHKNIAMCAHTTLVRTCMDLPPLKTYAQSKPNVSIYIHMGADFHTHLSVHTHHYTRFIVPYLFLLTSLVDMCNLSVATIANTHHKVNS